MAYDYDIGIIGGGSAGLTVASGAAQAGARTLLIEKEEVLGGDCLHYGCVPSKTLIRTAHVHHLLKNAARFGLPPVEPRPVDFRQVRRRIEEVIAVIQEHDSEERFCNLGVKVEFGDPEFMDDRAVKLGGKTVSAKYWVLATGSSPDIPAIEGLDRTPFITNREIFYLDRLPSSMIILGAGPIAVEMAQAFSRLGTRVEVVQRSAQILSREDPDMADAVMACLQDEGITFHLSSSVVRVGEAAGTKEVTIQDGDGRERKLTAEKLLVALGRRANLSGLGLEAAGVEFDHKGAKVDARLRTTRKHIFAAGDVTGKFLFTHAAGYEGGIVISNAIFHLPRKADYLLMPWCTYTDPELASIGANEKILNTAEIKYSVWTEEFAANDRAQAGGTVTGRIKMLLDEKEKPLGVQILGPGAGELIGEWVAVLNGKVKLSTLAGAVHPYPTLSEINKRVAGDLLATKIFSAKVRKGLKLFFNLRGRACHPPEG